MDSTGRWWRVNGIEVDLSAEVGSYPMLVRAAALAHRDAATPEEQDVAAFLDWATTEDVPGAHMVAVEFMSRKAWQLVSRLNAALDRLEKEAAA